MVAVPAAGGCLPPPGRSMGRWPSRQGMGKEEETAEVVAAAGDPALTVLAAGSPTGTVPWREPATTRDRLFLQARRAAAAAKRKDFLRVNNEKANPASPGGAA